MSKSSLSLRVAALVVALLIAAACGDDSSDESSATTAVPTTTTTAAAEPAPTGPIEVTGVDYGFEGLPETVAAGTELTFTNASDTEVHEIVMIQLDEDETRPLDDLLALPQAEQQALGTTSAVNVAFPEQDGMTVVGDLTLNDPGRYLAICSIPEGADPDEYAAAAAAAQGGPPQVDGGPPHLVLGMAAEVTVE